MGDTRYYLFSCRSKWCMPTTLLQEAYGIAKSSLEATDTNTENVLAGKEYYVFQNGELVRKTGAMYNRGTWTTTLNPEESVTIPSGYHSGSGKVTCNAVSSNHILWAYIRSTFGAVHHTLGNDGYYMSGAVCKKACNVTIKGSYKLGLYASIDIMVNNTSIYHKEASSGEVMSSYSVNRSLNVGDELDIRMNNEGYGIFCELVVLYR